jgi:hypothetical protein
MSPDGISKEQIARRAYELYLECGCDGGHDAEHWLAAEEELRQAQKLSESIPSQSKTAVAGARDVATRGKI